jgi:thymidylate synthase
LIPTIAADTADEAWSKAATRFERDEDVLRQESRIGNTLELLHAIISIDDPRQRWVLSRQPAINPAFAIAEVVWILNGRNDAAFINHWNPALPRFAGHGDTYYGAYGYRLRSNLGIDQLERAWGALSANSASRQIVLQIWDSRLDLPSKDGQPRSPDIPCNICSMLKLREGRLEWMQVLRSNDLFLGVPHNLVQFTTLQEVFAGWLGVGLGQYHQLSDSLHIYERDRAHVRNRTEPTNIRNSDSLMLPKAESDAVWHELDRHMTRLVEAPSVDLRTWKHMVAAIDAPQPFLNLWTIVAGDDARRRGWLDEAQELVSDCTNPLLRQAWMNWVERKQLRASRPIQ